MSSSTASSSPTFSLSFFFFFNDTATTEIYTLSLHDALPISRMCLGAAWREVRDNADFERVLTMVQAVNAEGLEVCATLGLRSEEHTSELQSPCNLVCRLLLEKKKIRPWDLRLRRPHVLRRT